MKIERKIFLLVWIPIVILISLAIFLSIGTEATVLKLHSEETVASRTSYSWGKEVYTLEKASINFLVVISISAFLFFIVGLDDVENVTYEDIKRRRAK